MVTEEQYDKIMSLVTYSSAKYVDAAFQGRFLLLEYWRGKKDGLIQVCRILGIEVRTKQKTQEEIINASKHKNG